MLYAHYFWTDNLNDARVLQEQCLVPRNLQEVTANHTCSWLAGWLAGPVGGREGRLFQVIFSARSCLSTAKD